MGFEGIVWKLYDLSNWIMKMILLNILWIVFSIIGLVIFGFFPATAAMFAVTRKWVLGETDIPVYKTFVKTYKSSFTQMNLIGGILSILGLFLYIDLRFFQTTEYILLSFLSFFIIFAMFIYFAVVLYIFPMYVHFECKTLEYLKRSIIIVLGKPIHTIMMIVGSYLVYVVISMIPVLVVFISGSLLSLVLMWIAMKSFPRYEIKVGEIE
ncbi:YesL family protein [Ornithinibacillus salinisoli]|uniref:YesL family protein n=1 Tax=Ornithinibacillus salinisoli TaxID=1848459 RepID=A0ABW4W2Y2_9BACI